jgi:hypothetical protein
MGSGDEGTKNNIFFLMFDLEWGRLREWGEYRTAITGCKTAHWTTKLIFRTNALIGGETNRRNEPHH